MKKTKQTLAFEQLEAEMELISRSEQITFSGGTGTAEDLVNAMSSSGQSYYGASSDSNYDYSSGGYTYGSNGQPSSAYYGSNSNSSNGYSSNSYSSNSYSSNSSNGYSSNGYSSNSYSSAGYSSSGYGFNTGTNPIQLDTVTVQGQANNGLSHMLTDLWNSPVMRTIVPDIVSYNISVSGVLGVGGGKTYSLNLVTRGQVSLSVTQTESLRAGLHADASINGSVGWFLGSPQNASIDGILGLGVDGSVDLGAAGIGGWTSNNGTTGMPTWLGLGAGGGSGVGGSVGVSNTVIFTINGTPLRINF